MSLLCLFELFGLLRPSKNINMNLNNLTKHCSTNLTVVQLQMMMMQMMMRNMMRLMMIHWWRRRVLCRNHGVVSTSSGAAFALQVSIAVWSDAAGICGRKGCLVCAKFFHTALFQQEKCDLAAAAKTQSSQKISTFLADSTL